MCGSASFRVLQDKVLYSRIGDSHGQIVEEHHLRATAPDDYDVLGVPVEFAPPDNDYALPFDRWKLHLDETINRDSLPPWYSARRARRQCLDAMSDWWSYHAVDAGKHICDMGRTLIVLRGSPQIIVRGGDPAGIRGALLVCGKASPKITQSGGDVFVYGRASPSILQSGGDVFIRGKGRPNIGQCGGYVFTLDQSRPKIVKSDGEVHAYGKSRPSITQSGGWAYACGESQPKIVQSGGLVNTLNDSHPSIVQIGGTVNTLNDSRPHITQSGGCVYTYDNSRPSITQSGGEVHAYGKNQPRIIRWKCQER